VAVCVWLEPEGEGTRYLGSLTVDPRRVARHPPSQTKESKMGAPLLVLCNPSAGFSVENRFELPAVEVIVRCLAVRVAGRAKFASRAPAACTALAATFLSLLATTTGAATAHELFIHQIAILAGDPASRQLKQGKPADHPNPPQHGAPEVTASGFDPATLPPIESIDAQTDITLFVQNGVPEKLRLAALRRAWTVDPAIRDFKGLQENDWNFNDANSTPGFGELNPEVDVKRMVAEILGEAPRLTLARWSDRAK
jgi:hypothetical protein